MSDELVQWFGEQLAEDDRIARATAAQFGAVWTVDGETVGSDIEYVSVVDEPGSPVAYIAEHAPSRVLREIDAKRAVLAAYAEVAENYGCDDVEYADGWVSALRFAVRQLATAYSNRPGYLDEWRP